MKKSNKKIPKTHLPKFTAGGGTTRTLANGNQVSDARSSTEGTQNIYNDKRSSKLGIGDYANYATAAVNLGTGLYNNQNLQGAAKDQANANTINSTVDAVAGSATPWYGYAKTASGIGKSLTSPTSVTDPTTGKTVTQSSNRTNQAFSDTFTPMHETTINKASEGDWGGAALNTITGGVWNTMDNYLNGTNQKEFDKAKANEATYNQEQTDLANKQNAAAQQQQSDYINSAIQSGLANQQPQSSYVQYAMGGMKMQPNAIPQYPNGGKIPKLKPRDFKAEKAHYEEQTRGANQADGSGISSAELAYRYSKLIDPTGATSAVEIGKNFYNGNPQDPIDYLGLVRVPFVSQGMKPLSKLAKQGNKASVLINTITKTNDVAESFRAGGMMGDKYGNGGAVPREFANSEVELEENTLNPDGSTNQYDGASHEAGGIPTNLDAGTLIFSDKLKMGGKTFAKLNKPNMTHKEDKILSDDKASAMSKLTANLMKQAKNKSSVELFEAQEALKQSKLDSYTKRLGGIMKYPNGGITPIQYKQAQSDSLTLYNAGLQSNKRPYYDYPGTTDAMQRLQGINSTNGKIVAPEPIQGEAYGNQAGYNGGYNVKFQKPTMIPYNQTQIPADNNGIEKVESYAQPIGKPVNHPVYNQYIPGINQSKQRVVKEEFRKGGVKLPQYDEGGAFIDGVWVPNSSYKPGTMGFNDSGNTPNNPSNYSLQSSYNPNVLPWNRTNDSKQGPNGKSEQYVNDNPQQQFQEETLNNNTNSYFPETKSNKFDWKGLGTQALSFAANNAGNIFDLARADKTETRKYNRATENLVTPNFRDADQKYLYMKNALKGASLGASGYLANLQQAHVNNVLNKAQIQQAADNTNAGIKNQVSQYNTGIANEEILANAKIRANARNIKQSAIASIGSNTANQMNDVRNTNMDKKKMEGLIKMYPSLSKDPKMLEYFMSFNA